MKKLLLFEPSQLKQTDITLPTSKSILNRMLIITALSDHERLDIIRVSDAEDAQDMKRCLLSKENTIYTGHGGTTYRFLLSYFAITATEEITLKASPQMTQRPIGALVDILRELNADIQYLGKKSYPPVKISPRRLSPPGKLKIPTHVSSQFISSVLLISPYLERKFIIECSDVIVSQPYIDLTIEMMVQNGANIQKSEDAKSYFINPSKYHTSDLSIESDWSAASYFVGLTLGAGKDFSIALYGLEANSFQADSVILDIGTLFGLSYSWQMDGSLLLENQASFVHPVEVFIDFTNSPDIAQTVMAIAVITQVNLKFTGVQTLYIKETNRMKAMETELAKLNCDITTISDGIFFLDTSQRALSEHPIEFKTYGDHRMAMSLSLLCLLQDVIILDPDVVRKSYHNYWEDFSELGILIEER